MIKFDFNEKTALVTGAIKGIGKSIATKLLEANARVVLTYLKDENTAKNTELYFQERGFAEYSILKSDVSERNSIKSLIDYTETKWSQPISYIVNNAGILKQGDFFALDDSQWDKTFETNLRGPFILCQEYMKRNCKNGSIVNIASIGGQIGGEKALDYAASKAGLIGLTSSLARIGSRYGIRVNAVSPGWIETPIFSEEQLTNLRLEAKQNILLHRIGMPDEVASAVLFLLSDAASYITGHCLNVNGGMYFG